MNDSINDIIILYLAPSVDNNINFIEEFKQAAEYFNNNSLKNIKFGYIDSVLNSDSIIFPTILEFPTIKFISTKNLSNSCRMFHDITKFDIIRFIKRVSNENYTINNIPKKDNDEFKQDVGKFIKYLTQLPQDEQQRLIIYFREMWLDLGIEIGIETETNTENYVNDSDFELKDENLQDPKEL